MFRDVSDLFLGKNRWRQNSATGLLLLLLVCTPRSLGRLFTITRGRWRRDSTGCIGPVGPPGVLAAGLACIVGFQECPFLDYGLVELTIRFFLSDPIKCTENKQTV